MCLYFGVIFGCLWVFLHEETERYISDIRLSSFSSKRIVIIKQYDISKDTPKDYQTYEEDKEAINVIEPEHLTQEILDGKYIRDEAELYNFLESYSS